MVNNKPLKILHITPHLGGGVGTVVLENIIYSNKHDPDLAHSILCLDYINEYSKKILLNENIPFNHLMYKNIDSVLKLIEQSDIILVHWWNHPLLMDFLIRNTLPECIMLIWCHIVGTNAPNNLTEKILKYPDRFIFTTPVSLKVPEYKNLEFKFQKNISTIWSTAGSERLAGLELQKHQGFHVGYIGSLEPTKITPRFIDLCKAIRVQDMTFTVIGNSNLRMLEDVRRNNLINKFNFTGFIANDVKKWEYLSTFDVFGYPLTRDHYGSCDQSLQEAMAAGVPPVVFNNSMESYMVRDLQTGLVVENDKQYIAAIESLCTDENRRKQLGSNARKYAKENWSIKKSATQWKQEFINILSQPKNKKFWEIKNPKKITAADVFIESLGEHAKPFRDFLKSKQKTREKAVAAIRELATSYNWTSPTKSTAHHFLHFFPDDVNLKIWSAEMK